MTMRIDIDPSELPGAVTVGNRGRGASAEQNSWRLTNIQAGTPLFELFEGLYDAVLITNLDGLILAGNARASTCFQYH